jgi:hypothetical protein
LVTLMERLTSSCNNESNTGCLDLHSRDVSRSDVTHAKPASAPAPAAAAGIAGIFAGA